MRRAEVWEELAAHTVRGQQTVQGSSSSERIPWQELG